MACLGNEPRLFCHFWGCTQVLHFKLNVDYEGYFISSKGFLPTVVDICSSELNSLIPIRFSALIPKMSMLILTICLNMSNLPWFMDLTFQVPMQYCSSQHWTLLSSPNTSTAERHFRFCPLASFFLELLVVVLCSSAVAYWTASNLGDPSFGVFSFFCVLSLS